MTSNLAGLEALADPTRRAIFEMVGAGPAAVGDLADRLPVSRPAVSQHLKVLADAGLVTVRPLGRQRVYALNPDGIAGVRRYFDQFWAAALNDFAAFAQQDATNSTPSTAHHQAADQAVADHRES